MFAVGSIFSSTVLDLGLSEMRTIEAENLVSGLGRVIGTERGRGSRCDSNSYPHPGQRGGTGKLEGARLRTVPGGGGRVGRLWGT